MPNRKLREYGTPVGYEEPGRTTTTRPKVGPADAETRRRKLREALQATESPPPKETPPSLKRERAKRGTVALRERQLRELGE